jgi:hypothetical protein
MRSANLPITLMSAPLDGFAMRSPVVAILERSFVMMFKSLVRQLNASLAAFYRHVTVAFAPTSALVVSSREAPAGSWSTVARCPSRNWVTRTISPVENSSASWCVSGLSM